MNENQNLTKEGLTKKELFDIYLRYQIMVESAMSYEKMHGASWAWSYLPFAKKYYSDDPDKFSNFLTRHSVFYNTEPQTGQLVNGIVASLDEKIALGDTDVDETVPVTVKASMMGPLAGIGDSVIQGILIPTLLSIGMGLSTGGSPLGAIFYILAYGLIVGGITIISFNSGYKLGVNAIDSVIGENAKRITNMLNTFGIMIVGGLSATTIAAVTTIEIPAGDTTQPLQEILDGIFPGILPLTFVLITWWLISEKKYSPTKVILVLIGVVTAAVLLGVM
ncbi:PTS system mannose/fructose/sorbose family transporter subunit IID [Carnobacteriaceae bacterium 52-44]